MKYPYRTILALIALATLMPQLHAQENLGRLFLTPERRDMLERQRLFNLQEQQTLEGETIQLDGVMVRSTGKKTVWINGQANRMGIETHVAPNNPGRAGLAVGNEQPTDLRVGQTINRATQKISDGLDGGRIEVKPPSSRH